MPKKFEVNLAFYNIHHSLIFTFYSNFSSTSSSESNTSSIDLDSPPPELTPNNRSTPTAPVVSRSPTSQNSQVLARIRRYDRENLRRKTLGGLDYLQAAKAHQEATISRPPVARTTSCERISPRPSSQTFGDLDLMPSWSVRKLREIYSRNANGSIQPADVTQMKQPQGKFHYDKNVRRERLYESYSSSNVVGGLVKATPVQIEVSDSRANYPVVYAPPLASETAKSHYQLRLKSASNLQHTDSNNNNTATTKSPVKRTERQNPDSYCSARQSNSRTINNTREPESYV